MYADVIIDISHEQIDRPFQYHIPQELENQVTVGKAVEVPFGKGNHPRKAYVTECSKTRTYESGTIKDILRVLPGSVAAEEQMITLAAWMKKEYGSTMIQALKTVIPVKEKVKQVQDRTICRTSDAALFEDYLETAKKKKWKGRLRLLDALQKNPEIPWSLASRQLGITPAIIESLKNAGVIQILSETVYRNPVENRKINEKESVVLNSQQRLIVDDIMRRYQANDRKPSLIHGITGSGKTEVYIRLIEQMFRLGKSSIVLIPEISLTYQTVMRFYERFGNYVSMVNSRLSAGEKYDQFERAKRGEVRIMIGPRSALFTPFEDLGLIIIDEEQESAYKSEQVPRYHARETAIERAEIAKAAVVLGSATPSLESYYRAKNGQYCLYTLTQRAVEGSRLAEVEVVDLRKEMAEGNRSVFSRSLQEKMDACLSANKQMMLFLNRRGYSKAVSCRSCGQPVGCPHCAVPLTEHIGKKMICHYCGYTIRIPDRCPSCGSPFLAGFGMGTQRIEEMVKERYPQARILRMDYDTTSGKDGHDQILQAFAAHEADILIGTQMIVKGHDFPEVTLVGILAADMSLYGGDFRSQERTFQLLTQAAGRAGRGESSGHVVIQTYDPENPAISFSAVQDYPGFYDNEIRFRKMMSYPPAGDMCEVITASQSSEQAEKWIGRIAALINHSFCGIINMIGPSDCPVAKIRDYWRKHLFIKTMDHEAFRKILADIGGLEQEMHKDGVYVSVSAQ